MRAFRESYPEFAGRSAYVEAQPEGYQEEEPYEEWDRDAYEDEAYEDEGYDDEAYDDEAYDDEVYDDESYDDEAFDDESDDDGYAGEAWAEDDLYAVEDVAWDESGEDWGDGPGAAVPESLSGYEDWQEAYADGVTYHDAVRTVLGPEGLTLSDGDVDILLAEVTAGMTPEEAESFWRSLGRAARSVGRTLVRAAPTVLPILGGAVGTLVGGPAGTAIGGALGRAAGGAVGRLAGRAPSRRRRGGRRAGPRARGRPSAVPAGASSAVTQLLSLLQNPALQRALLGASMGGSGSVRVGEQQLGVPFGAMMNALECLAAEAAEEMHGFHAGSGQIPEYLVGDDGEAIDDFGLPEARAAHLLELLQRQ